MADINLAQAVIDAASRVGQDGNGAGGLYGYLKQLPIRYPREFAKLASKARATNDDGA